jgi:hypothetical protein
VLGASQMNGSAARLKSPTKDLRSPWLIVHDVRVQSFAGERRGCSRHCPCAWARFGTCEGVGYDLVPRPGVEGLRAVIGCHISLVNQTVPNGGSKFAKTITSSVSLQEQASRSSIAI